MKANDHCDTVVRLLLYPVRLCDLLLTLVNIIPRGLNSLVSILWCSIFVFLYMDTSWPPIRRMEVVHKLS